MASKSVAGLSELFLPSSAYAGETLPSPAVAGEKVHAQNSDSMNLPTNDNVPLSQQVAKQYEEIKLSIQKVSQAIKENINQLEVVKYAQDKYKKSKAHVSKITAEGGPDAWGKFVQLTERHKDVMDFTAPTNIAKSLRFRTDLTGEFLDYMLDKSGYLLGKHAPNLMATIGAVGSVVSDGIVKSGKALSPYIVEVLGQKNVDKTLKLMKSTAEKIEIFANAHLYPGEQKLITFGATIGGSIIAAKTIKLAGQGVGAIIMESGAAMKTTKKVTMASWDAFDDFLFHKKKDLSQLAQHLPAKSILHEYKDIPIITKQRPKLFEKHLTVVEKAIAEKANISTLPKEVLSDCVKLIKTNKKGIVTGFHHTQNHHILLQNHRNKAFKESVKEIMEKAGMSIDDPANMILLPDKKGKSFYGSKRTIHDGYHDEKYCEKIAEAIKEIKYDGMKKNWKQAGYRKKVLKLLKEKRKGLIKGKTQLNKAQPLHNEVVNKKTK